MTKTMSIACLLLGAIGCGEDPVCDVQAGKIEVTVDTAGEQPLFSWNVGDAISLAVTDTEGQDVWQFQCKGAAQGNSNNCIKSGVTYGELPDGTEEFSSLTPLSSGATYTVLVDHNTDGEKNCIIVETGEATFVAP